jgi:hypothetical protein
MKNSNYGQIIHILRWETTPKQLRGLADEIEKDFPITCVEISKNVELILYNTDYDKRKQKKSQKKYLDTEDDPDTLQAMDESDKEYRKKWNKVRC